jgi:hypothetical protein
VTGTDKPPGNTEPLSWPNKPAPAKKHPAPSITHLTPTPTEALVAAMARPPPTSARQAAALCTLPVTLRGSEEGSLFVRPQPSGSHCSQHLNTIEKCNIQKGVMDSLRDKT